LPPRDIPPERIRGVVTFAVLARSLGGRSTVGRAGSETCPGVLPGLRRIDPQLPRTVRCPPAPLC